MRPEKTVVIPTPDRLTLDCPPLGREFSGGMEGISGCLLGAVVWNDKHSPNTYWIPMIGVRANRAALDRSYVVELRCPSGGFKKVKAPAPYSLAHLKSSCKGAYGGAEGQEQWGGERGKSGSSPQTLCLKAVNQQGPRLKEMGLNSKFVYFSCNGC